MAATAARDAASNAATLDELRALLEGFTGCGLRATATQVVFADGNPAARVMFVGVAPAVWRLLLHRGQSVAKLTTFKQYEAEVEMCAHES